MPTTQPDYGWPLPEDVDLVNAGAQAMRDLADAIAASLTGQFVESTGPSTVDVTGTVPVDIATAEVYGRAGIPIRCDASAWLQNLGANNAGVRFGVGASGGGLDEAATSPSAAYFVQLALATSVTSVYATMSMTRTFVPTADGLVTITLQGWATGVGPQGVNYARLSVDTRAPVAPGP